METRVLPTDTPEALASAVTCAADLLTAGECVALPTETVYGLAADALRSEAVVKIFEVKERPFFDPLIVHLPDRAWLERVARIESPLVPRLIEAFWPGPFTLVLPRREIIPDIVTAGLDTVAVRMSAHPVFQGVAARFDKPLAAPSANPFGCLSPTSAEHVRDGLDGRIPLIVDGGLCAIGIESTIVAVEGERLRILRAGPILREELAPFADVHFISAGGTPNAPGQLKSHYAPRTPLFLLRPNIPVRLKTTSATRRGCLAWQEKPDIPSCYAVEVLSPTGDLREAAATLFAKLRRLDASDLDEIIAEPVPEHGLGVAIMDRLRKAAAR